MPPEPQGLPTHGGVYIAGVLQEPVPPPAAPPAAPAAEE
jgi:hypothetical protein